MRRLILSVVFIIAACVGLWILFIGLAVAQTWAPFTRAPAAACSATERLTWSGTALSCTACTDCVALGTGTTGDYVATVTAGVGLTGSGAGEGSTPTLSFSYTTTAAANPVIPVNQCLFTSDGAGGIICEGSVANNFEIELLFLNPTVSDKFVTVPDETGTICTTGSICTGYQQQLSGDVVATGGNAVIQNNSVALGGDTTGNYVGTLGVNTPLSCAGCTAAEGNTPVLSLADVTPDCTANQFVNAVGANLSLGCAQPSHAGLSGLTTGDDHTQYVLKAGRASGLNDFTVSLSNPGSIMGTTVASGGLIVQANTLDATTGSLFLKSGTAMVNRRLSVGQGISGETITAADRMLSFPFDYKVSAVGIAGGISVININPTVHVGQASSFLTPWVALSTDGMSVLHDDNTNTNLPSVQLFYAHQAVTSSVANQGPPVFTLWDNALVTKNTASGNLNQLQTVRSVPAFTVSGAITSTITSGIQGLYWAPTVNTDNAGGSVTLPVASAVDAVGVALSGAGAEACTVQYGLKVGNGAGTFNQCTSNVGVYNSATTVYPPTSQSLTAAGNTILPNATIKFIDSNASYTMTSTPTIATANVPTGQVITLINAGANNITLRDERNLTGTKLYLPLSAASAITDMLLNPTDSVTLVWSGAWWFCIGSSNNA